MAQFSQGFLSSLGRPAMAESLFGLGATIGGLPGQRKQQQKQQAFNQLMQQGQQAMASGDAAALARIGQQLAAAGYQKEAQQLSQASREASEKAKRVSAGQALLSGVPSRMRQGAGTLAQQGLIEQAMEAQGLAQARQIDKGKQALATFASARGMQMSDPRAREGFFRIARAYEVPMDQATTIYENFTKTGGEDRTTKGEVVIRDSQGNLFTRASQYDERGRGREVILPFPGSPKEPVGALTIVSGTTGAGAFDRPGLAGQTTEEQDFNQARVAAVVQLPSLRRSAKNVREAIDLLESGDVTTGGFVRRMSRGLTDFLGKTPKDIGEFETRLGDIVLARLESFTGAISEGERNFLIEQIGNYQASGESNLGRLKVLLEQAEDLMRDGMALATAKDFASYQRSLTQPDLSFIPEAERQDAMEAFQRGEVTVQELRGMY
jgi:hypothetical protein